ncbi:MAG TPA: hypothetical protein VHS27_21855 [Gaiellales bacterium]|jgi:hypothetical protein|nr:hypothetical protein [Gaiellales bacterium]
MSRLDFSVLPDDLARLYAGECVTQNGLGYTPTDPVEDQLELLVDDAATEFRRWLEAQPLPEWMDVA